MKTITSTLVLCAALTISSAAQAALIDRGGGLIYDTDLNVTWLQDTNYGKGSSYDDGENLLDGLMTWQSAMNWAANLSYYDSVRNVTYTDWRLPKIDPVNGISLIAYSTSFIGTTDRGYNIGAQGTVYAGSTASEMAHLFYNTLKNKGACDAVTSTITTCSLTFEAYNGMSNTGPFENWWGDGGETRWTSRILNDNAMVFGNGGWQGSLHQWGNVSSAWAVRDGDVATVPIPAAAWLLGSGLLGLIGAGRRRQAH